MSVNFEQSAESMVRSLYNEFLGREPDPVGFQLHTERFTRLGIAAVLRDFIDSSEFAARSINRPNPLLNWGPPMKIDADVSTDEIARLWQHVGTVWSQLGNSEPHWSVITDDRFKRDRIQDAESRDIFDKSGKEAVDLFKAFLARNQIEFPKSAVAVEYGCGVGRITKHLAPETGRLLAMDISAPHLQVAADHLSSAGVDNVEMIHVTGAHSLEKFDGCDLFFSLIVLQHNPPPLIIDILERAFRGLKPGGIAYFQIPTYAAEYSFNLASFWQNEGKAKNMEMHFAPQHLVLAAGRRHGVQPLEILADQHAGHYERWLSHTFLMQKF